MAPGGLWQRPYQIHSDALEGHLDDGQRNQRAGGRCLGRGPLTGRAGLTEAFHRPGQWKRSRMRWVVFWPSKWPAIPPPFAVRHSKAGHSGR